MYFVVPINTILVKNKLRFQSKAMVVKNLILVNYHYQLLSIARRVVKL